MNPDLNRRQVLQMGVSTAAALGIPVHARAQGCAAIEGTVRDRLWLFAVPTNSGFPYTGRRSVMTPAEGAYYLGIPNLLMIQANDREEAKYGRFDPPFEQYAIGLRPFRRVAWSLTGSGGVTSPEYRQQVLEVSKKTPNFVGLYMDDFFTTKPKGQRAVLTLDELRNIRDQARGPGKKLDIWVTYYTRLLDLPLDDYLKMIDVITLWTWKPEDLENLESNLSKAEKVVPALKKTQGCYFYDFTKRVPVSIADMKLQCETGLSWLRQGRIEGMVFLQNCLEDMGFDCVEWTREWIRKVGDTRL